MRRNSEQSRPHSIEGHKISIEDYTIDMRRSYKQLKPHSIWNHRIEPFTLKYPSWQAEAACADADPKLFFPEDDDSDDSTCEAKAICAACEVRDECLDFALANPAEKFGVWGGTSAQERRRLKRKN